jgi:tungstate transport system substrate-binding protein
LPDFESRYNVRVDVIAGGTGEVLKFGANGDVDVVLVHSRSKEDEFVASGAGLNRLDVMYNDFVIVGPIGDPAGLNGVTEGPDAFTKIANSKSAFASRGDDSGTHNKELSLWEKANIVPSSDSGWYFSTGQGQAETLTVANEKSAYALTDRGTWLAQKHTLTNLKLWVGGEDLAHNPDKNLLNPYGVILVNPAKQPQVNFDLATTFAQWLTSVATQQLIADYGRDPFGQPLFYPSSADWKVAHP